MFMERTVIVCNNDPPVPEPKGERVWMVFTNTEGIPLYFITSKESREYYYMYQVLADGSAKRLGRDRSPLELENKFAPNIVSGK